MLICGDVMTELQKMETNSVDLVFGSPPYADKGERYGTKDKWPTQAWVEWMRKITVECTRVSKGYVIWVVNGFVKDRHYHPVCELLLCDMYKCPGIICEHPVIWHKNSAPNKRNWFVNSWEYILCFYNEHNSPTFDWESIAEPPKYSSGGKFKQRDKKGNRKEGSEYPQNALARPRDVVEDFIYVTVGGGHMGHKLSHSNEAPFPLKLAEKFVLSCCPPGGTVCDPFIGSGSTAHAAILHKRKYIGIDVRQSQIDLTQKRINDVSAKIAQLATDSDD